MPTRMTGIKELTVVPEVGTLGFSAPASVVVVLAIGSGAGGRGLVGALVGGTKSGWLIAGCANERDGTSIRPAIRIVEMEVRIVEGLKFLVIQQHVHEDRPCRVARNASSCLAVNHISRSGRSGRGDRARRTEVGAWCPSSTVLRDIA